MLWLGNLLPVLPFLSQDNNVRQCQTQYYLVISGSISTKNLRRQSPELPKYQSVLRYPATPEACNLRRHILCRHILQQRN